MLPTNHDMLKPGETCWRLARAERAALLVDGENYYPRLAEAMEQARRCIYIVGWDIDSRIRLRRGEGAEDETLAQFLDRLVRSHEELEIYLLDWDFAMLYALEREPLPLFKFSWKTHRRVHFHLDDRHPPGASHHQKIVVIDDQVAFCGGFDLGRWRWDGRRHLAEDSRRRDVGKAYPPFHDIQSLVTGPVAGALGELVRQRWRAATGRDAMAPGERPGQIAFEDLTWWLHDVEVAIMRTMAAYDGRPQVEEGKAFYLEAIKAARHTIYIENQYLTSQSICDALRASLQRDRGPAIVLVLPKNCPGWLEQETMGRLRNHQVARLRQADSHGRLNLYYPERRDLKKEIINVHSKLLIVDDWLLRVGSSNLSNRSMGFDTECDLAFVARNIEQRQAILSFRHDLLAEHLDRSVEEIAARWEQSEQLQVVIQACGEGQRCLLSLPDPGQSVLTDLVSEAEIVDPERPVALPKLFDLFGLNDDDPQRSERGASRQVLLLVGVVVLLLVLSAAWRWSPLQHWVDLDHLVQIGTQLRHSPLAYLLVLGGFLVGCVIMVPVTLLIVATMITFGPFAGVLLALGGSLLGAAAGFGAGSLLGRDTIRKLAGKRLNRISRKLADRGWLAMAGIRLLPIAPFTIINMIVGASRIRFSQFLLGTLIGMIPGVLAIGMFEGSIEQALRSSHLAAWLIVIAGAGSALLVLWWARRWYRLRDADRDHG